MPRRITIRDTTIVSNFNNVFMEFGNTYIINGPNIFQGEYMCNTIYQNENDDEYYFVFTCIDDANLGMRITLTKTQLDRRYTIRPFEVVAPIYSESKQ
jgi:hypothetical protein